MPTAQRPGARIPLAACSLALLALCLLPRLAAEGAFVDSLTYATLARNLAQDWPGSPWHLRYTETLHAQFFEHPPLGIWLLAGLFAWLGDSLWVERVHAALMALALCWAMARLWTTAMPRSAGAWLPVLLLVCCPLTGWILANNMLEAPLTVFCLLAASQISLGWQCARPWQQATHGCLAGIFMALAVLSKGPTALFVGVIVCLPRWIAPQTTWRGGLRVAGGFVLAMGCLSALLVLCDASRAYLVHYLQQQVASSLLGGREVAASRFLGIGRVVSEMAVPMVPALALVGLAQRRTASPPRPPRQPAAGLPGPALRAWGWVALTASVPTALSPKQSGWYIYQSLPFFCLVLAAAVAPAACRFEQWVALQPCRKRGASLVAAGLFLTAAATGYAMRSHIARHVDFHADFTRQPLHLPARTQLHVCPESLHTNWGLHANMARYFGASLTAQPSPWWLVDKQAVCLLPAACTLHHPPHAQRYQIYHCLP